MDKLRDLRNEQEIMRQWTGDLSEPLVSVCCTTYNHEKYIEDALEGFLLQETNFPFEIIIHDDASSDNTPVIIKEYHSQYPEIIKPIFQKENQYSKGGFKPSVFAAKHSNGKFIALCEGDDYWLSNLKLQKQIDAMQKHPELDFSYHSAFIMRNGVLTSKPSWVYKDDQIFHPDFILNHVGSFAPTSSYVLNRNVIDNMPEWFFKIAPIGDFFLEMYGSKKGGALYFNEPLSVYRVHTHGSWTSNMNSNYINKIKHAEKMLDSLQLMKSDFKPHVDLFKKRESILYCTIANCHLQNHKDNLFQEFIEKSIKKYSFYSNKQRLAYALRCMPNLLRYFAKIDSFLLMFAGPRI